MGHYFLIQYHDGGSFVLPANSANFTVVRYRLMIHDKRFCTYVDGVIEWNFKMQCHFTSIASKSDGNFLQNDVLRCKKKISSSLSFPHTTILN
jgi:hypothetical protein